MTELTKDEFCTRFIAEMMKALVPGGSETDLRDYAEQAAPTYWDDPDQRAEGPEACAEADISYWEED